MGTVKTEYEKLLYLNPDEMSSLADEDCVLKWLISRIEAEGLSFNITLNVKGTVISGEIINKKEYSERLNQYLMDITKIKGISKMNVNHQKDEYVHLKNAKIYFSLMDTAPLDGGVLWRGKLSSIDGFILGLFRSYP